MDDMGMDGAFPRLVVISVYCPLSPSPPPLCSHTFFAQRLNPLAGWFTTSVLPDNRNLHTHVACQKELNTANFVVTSPARCVLSRQEPSAGAFGELLSRC